MSHWMMMQIAKLRSVGLMMMIKMMIRITSWSSVSTLVLHGCDCVMNHFLKHTRPLVPAEPTLNDV